MDNIPQWVVTIVTVLGSVAASSGFWSYMQNRSSKKDARTQLLLAIAHDKIVYLCEKYLERGDYITDDEYESLMLFWKPYIACGGNGTAKKSIERVDRELKIINDQYSYNHIKMISRGEINENQ